MKKSSWMTIIPTVICAIALLILGYYCGKTKTNIKQIDTVTVSDTVWRDTTITEKELVPKEVIKKKVDTVYTDKGDTLQLITESKRYDRTLTNNKDTADVEIYTTGINTSLDSLKWRLKTHTVINTVEITKYIQKNKTIKDRIHLEPQVGVGYGLIGRKVDVYVGVGLGVDLW
jgi:hypothetical protein